MVTENLKLHPIKSKARRHAYIKKSLLISGPSGRLELSISYPRKFENLRSIAIICHPHPLFSGTMDNKVVQQVANALNDINVATVRFNFRGVGKSEGKYSDGIGETEDLLAVIKWLREYQPKTPLWLAGFSFGAYVALRAWPDCMPETLITIAPPVNFFDFKQLVTPKESWIVIHGDADEIVPFTDVSNWIKSLAFPPKLACLIGTGHFFHGQLNNLSAILWNYLLDEQPVIHDFKSPTTILPSKLRTLG